MPLCVCVCVWWGGMEGVLGCRSGVPAVHLCVCWGCVGGPGVQTWVPTHHFREDSFILRISSHDSPMVHSDSPYAGGETGPGLGPPTHPGFQGSVRSGAWAPTRGARAPHAAAARCRGSRARWLRVQPRHLGTRAPPRARVPGFLRLPREGAGRRRGLFVVVPLGPAPKGGADHAARGPASPPPPRPAHRLFVSNIRVSPLARLRGRGSGAILDAVQLPSPRPSPRSWPLRTRPLRPGPGPSPATQCLSPAPPGPPRPAAVPRPPHRPGVRAAACAARSGPEPGPAARLSEPSRCPGRRRRKRAGNQPTRGSGKQSAAAAGPRAPWERRAALPAGSGCPRGGAAEHDGALGGPRPPLGIAVRG